jgi:hypothetical protein
MGHRMIPHLRTIKRILESMHYTKRRLHKTEENKNTTETMFLRKKYCEVYLGLLRRPDLRILFVDEYRVDFHNNPDYAWAKKGSLIVDSKGSDYVSLFVALGLDGSYLFETAINKPHSNIVNADCMQKLLQGIKARERNQPVVVIVNSVGLSSTAMKQMVGAHGWKLLILPPKSEELNAASYYFREVKEGNRRFPPGITLGQLEGIVRETC